MSGPNGFTDLTYTMRRDLLSTLYAIEGRWPDGRVVVLSEIAPSFEPQRRALLKTFFDDGREANFAFLNDSEAREFFKALQAVHEECDLSVHFIDLLDTSEGTMTTFPRKGSVDALLAEHNDWASRAADDVWAILRTEIAVKVGRADATELPDDKGPDLRRRWAKAIRERARKRA